MKNFLLITLMVLSLMCTANAQTNTATLNDGTTVEYPANWGATYKASIIPVVYQTNDRCDIYALLHTSEGIGYVGLQYLHFFPKECKNRPDKDASCDHFRKEGNSNLSEINGAYFCQIGSELVFTPAVCTVKNNVLYWMTSDGKTYSCRTDKNPYLKAYADEIRKVPPTY